VPHSAVAQYLPFLRRYARALTGSQASGDAYVAATLEALIADRELLEDPKGPRVALYRLFTKIWNSVRVNGEGHPAGTSLPGEQKLANITPLPRQAFLLVALEGFSELDAARVLDIDVMNLRGLVEESGRELAAEIATDVLIIEDDTFIAMELETLVEGLGHRVLGVAHQEKAPRPDSCRYPACRRQLRPGSSQRAFGLVRGTGDLHHRLSRALLNG
jgi:DNA-directed RNA polymerase specialized sigma24 family protein